MADGINLDYYLAQLYKIQEHREQKAEKDIRKIFKQLMQELTAFVGTEYQKYAEDDKLSYEILNKHAEYAKFVSEVNKRLNISTQKAFKTAKALCDETYAKCFEGFSNAVQRAVEGNKNLSEILHTTTRSASQRAIKRAVENPVSGLTLTDNLEKNRKEIVYKINQEIGVGLANGSSYTNMAKRISEAVDGNYKKSMLITRTETHRVKEAGYNDAAKEVDDVLRDDESDFRMVKVWRTAQDDAVRKTNKANHKDMQGVVVLQDEEYDLGHGVKTLVPGSSGSAANDCNCRCRVSRKIMSEAEFFKATGRHFPKTEQEASGKKAETSTSEERLPAPKPLEEETKAVKKEKINLIGGKDDPELVDTIDNYYLPKEVRNKLDDVKKLKTYTDFEKHFDSLGIKLDTDLAKLKTERKDDDIRAVREQCQKIAVAIDTYQSVFGKDSLSKLKKIILYDEELDVPAAYHYNAIGENDPFAGTIRFRQWGSSGHMIFHELAHAFQDSNAEREEDAVIFANRLVKEAELDESFKAYSGASADVMDAERFADAFGYGFSRGSKRGVDFIENVLNVYKRKKKTK